MKLLLSLLNILLLLVNVYIIAFFFWIKDYKINWKIDSIYSYMLLEWPIKNMYNSIEWQNIVIEKGSNLIIKEKIYMITKDSIISWIFSIDKKWKIVKKPFKLLSLNEIYSAQKNLKSVVINSFWKEIMNSEILLNFKDIENIIKWNYIKGSNPEIY